MNGSANIHATCVRLGRAGREFRAPANAGVLLVGDSGSGKSDLALRLIGKGAQLVSDDRTVLSVERGRLIGRAPERIAGLIELRGVGMVEMQHVASVHIVLVVDLSGMVKRLPARRSYSPPKPLALPAKSRPALITLSAFDSSAPDKISVTIASVRRGLFRNSVKSN